MTTATATEINYNARPDGLTADGKRAHEIIMRVLTAHKALDTGGGTSFRSPADHAARGEKYGERGVLIVVYDGGALRPFFSLDAAYATARPGGPNCYARYEEMQAALEAAGMYFEECTGWYAAVYNR